MVIIPSESDLELKTLLAFSIVLMTFSVHTEQISIKILVSLNPFESSVVVSFKS